MKGGVAKTTLAINIADCLARRHDYRVLVVDVDPQFNATQCLIDPENYIEHVNNNRDTIVTIFDRPNRATASSVSGSSVSQTTPLEDIAPYRVKNNLDLLPGNLELYRLEMSPGEGRENRLKKFLENIEEKDVYDLVIVDTPPTPSVWMTSALIASDFYVIPVKADPISLTGIDLLRSVIEDKKDNFSLTIKCAGLIFTIAEENTVVFRKGKEQISSQAYWKKQLYHNSLPKRTEIARIQGEQKLILDCQNSEIKSSLAKITEEFLHRIGEK